jgi:hypothetical protein
MKYRKAENYMNITVVEKFVIRSILRSEKKNYNKY